MSIAESSPSSAPPATAELMEQILYEVKRVVVGQDRFLERVMVAILAGGEATVRGVDGVQAGDVATLVRTLAQERQLVAAATGATDWVSDGRAVLAVENGHPWLQLVTGTGCMATSVVAAFVAVHPNPLEATAAALAAFGLAAEQAAQEAQGPGTLQARLLDSLHGLTPAQLAQGARLRRVA